jgi:hypothetical protein
MASSSLVADYDSNSSDENDEDEINSDATLHGNQLNAQVKSDYFAIATERDADSDDDKLTHSAEIADETSVTTLPNPLSDSRIVLPSPNFASTSDTGISSVFVTAYQRAEDAKQSILERHVKMTNMVKEEPAAGQRKNKNVRVCLNFQKGRCRFAQKCRFSHGQPVGKETGAQNASCDSLSTLASSSSSVKWNVTQNLNHHEQRALSETLDVVDEDSFDAAKKRTHRSGITDSLVPPKRAMTSLTQLRGQERPWTMN